MSESQFILEIITQVRKIILYNFRFYFFSCANGYSQFSVAPTWLKRTEHDTCGMAPVFEMFNHAEDNNAFFDFDKINKKLYVAAIKDRDSSDINGVFSPTVRVEGFSFWSVEPWLRILMKGNKFLLIILIERTMKC